MSKRVHYYKPLPKDDTEIQKALQQKAKGHSQEGFWKVYGRLCNEGRKWNHKRVHRVYKALGLPLRRKVKKRLPARVKEPHEVPDEPNHTWSVDIVTDVLENKRRFRSFNLIDNFNREVLYIEVDFSLTSNRIVWVLNHLSQQKKKTKEDPRGQRPGVQSPDSEPLEPDAWDRVQVYTIGKTDSKCLCGKV